MARHHKLRSAVAACAAALAAALNTPAGAQNGEGQESDAPSAVQQCLNQPAIKRTKILNEGNIVFITRDGTIYNNQLPRQCPSLKRSSLVNYGIEHSRLCAGNSFTVLYRIGNNSLVPGFVCQLGHFLPITAAELEDLTAMTDEDRARTSRRRSSREAVTTEQVELPPTEAAPAE